jgi:hypothetical protein
MAYGDLPLDAPEKLNKGMEGGACNRRSCQAEPALWYNHGMYRWYCGDCAIDIGQDVVNKRGWEQDWQPRLGHQQFETRQMIDEREAKKAVQTRQTLCASGHCTDLPPHVQATGDCHYAQVRP